MRSELRPVWPQAWGVAALLVACHAEPEPCTDDDCDARCAESVTQPPPGLPELTALERKLLGDRLRDHRAGVRLTGEQGFGVCTGSNSCERWVGANLKDPLPPGSYVVHAELAVPPDGAWTVTVQTTCMARQPVGGVYPVLWERSRELQVRARADGGVVVLDAIERLISPFPQQPALCEISLSDGVSAREPERFSVVLAGG
jgi:hypothetical protein